MQEYLHDVENQWWEYEDNILFDNHGVRPNEHHARQFRCLHQLLEEFGGGSESPGDEDQESMIVKRETPGSRAMSPVMSNRGAVGGESLVGAKMGVRPRRPGLA